jgi:hypothetical protein
MDRKEELKSMLQDLINDKPEQASLSLHNYLTDKIKEVAGTAQVADEPVTAVDDGSEGGEE